MNKSILTNEEIMLAFAGVLILVAAMNILMIFILFVVFRLPTGGELRFLLLLNIVGYFSVKYIQKYHKRTITHADNSKQ